MTAAELQVQGLSKNYGGVAALSGVDLTVRAGEIHGIIGPNGAGKSTLVDIISGFTSRSSGTIRMADDPITARAHELARRGIVRTFQHTSLFSGVSVASNLEIAAACSPSQRKRGRAGALTEILEVMDLTDHADTDADALSYGAQRRLAVAVALVSDPSILLLDEPAAGMNPVESEEFVGLVRTIATDRTVVLIEHDMSVIRALCERSTVLVDGHVLTAGPTTDVLDDPRVVEVYLGVSA